MTRPQQILELQRKLRAATEAKKRKTASILYGQLSSLMARQLRAETKQERKRA